MDILHWVRPWGANIFFAFDPYHQTAYAFSLDDNGSGRFYISFANSRPPSAEEYNKLRGWILRKEGTQARKAWEDATGHTGTVSDNAIGHTTVT